MSISLSCSCGAGLDLFDELAGQTIPCPKCGGLLSIPLNTSVGAVETESNPVIEIVRHGPEPCQSAKIETLVKPRSPKRLMFFRGWPWMLAAAAVMVFLMAAGAYTWGKWFFAAQSPGPLQINRWYLRQNTIEVLLRPHEIQQGFAVLIVEVRFPAREFDLEDDQYTNREELFHELGLVGERLLKLQKEKEAVKVVAADGSVFNALWLTCQFIEEGGRAIEPFGTFPKQPRFVDLRLFYKVKRKIIEQGRNQFQFESFPLLDLAPDKQVPESDAKL